VTETAEHQAKVPEDEDAALGVRSPLPHKLHPTAQKILAAAKKILTERGYRGMTLQAISAEAHVNKAGVWYYFGGKQQLVLALLEDVTIREYHHFGTMPPAGATLAQRVDLIVGSAAQVGERVRRFAAFYELLPEASRDAELHKHLTSIYQGWYAWAAEVLAPPVGGAETSSRNSAPLGQFASILLDGIFMQMVVAAPDFDLEAALEHARQALTHVITIETAGQPESSSAP
jgi:AcrR family transcriptional regulator